MTNRAVKAGLAVLTAALIWVFAWPAALGGNATYLVVAGSSMEPTYHTGDLVVVRGSASYEVGDPVAFRTPDGTVIHRIVGGDAEAGFEMLGDNNDDLDPWTPTSEQILGSTWLHVPQAGAYALRLREVVLTPPFPYLLAAFTFLAIALPDSRTRPTGHPDPEGDGQADEAPTEALQA